MSNQQFQPGQQHPEEWRRDLNPDAMAGQNQGPTERQLAGDVTTAYDLKAIHRHLADLSDDELRRIPVLPPGTRLQQGATYIDLRALQPQEFKAMGGQEADAEHWYVPKSEVDYPLWNKLIGVQNPARQDQADQA